MAVTNEELDSLKAEGDSATSLEQFIPLKTIEKVSSDEIDLAKNLIEQMTSAEFEPERYEDEYGKRAQAMIEEKVKGHEIKAAPKAPERGGNVVDIMAALKQSLAETESKRPARATAKEKKRKAGS